MDLLPKMIFVLRMPLGADHPSLLCLGTIINGEPIIKLPPKTVSLSKVDFSLEERAFYTQLEADSRSRFKVCFVSLYCF